MQTIITHDNTDIDSIQTTNETPLTKENYLSEFNTSSDKAYVRHNLEVPYIGDVQTADETNKVILEKVKSAIENHVSDLEHISQDEIINYLSEYVKIDGSTPFINPQVGRDPVEASHLTTKRWVESQLNKYLASSEKEVILKAVNNLLKSYPQLKDVYLKESIYNKDEIDSQLKNLVKNDGSTPFKYPQMGQYPKSSSHLATKGYIDNELQKHYEDIDPHNINTLINNKLKKYVLKSSVWDKTQTYSRIQIDAIINNLVEQAVREVIQEHTNLEDPHNILSKVYKLGYIKDDGSTAFTNPQKGVDAIDPQDLVTLHQLEEKVSINEPIWKTSGPVETTVGFVEDNSEIPKIMTLQQIMDAIFYGKGLDLIIPDNVEQGKDFEVTVCIHGSLATVESAKLLVNGEMIYYFSPSDFEESSCITKTIPGIQEDSDIVFQVTYTNDSEQEVTKNVKVSLPIFTLLLPYWKPLSSINIEYLEELLREDPINNSKQIEPDSITELTQEYSFRGEEKYVPCLIIPDTYPDLKSVSTLSQQFELEAFDIVTQKLKIQEKDVTYKFYKYKQPLLSANLKIIYNLK